MPAQILNGKLLADTLVQEVRAGVEARLAAGRRAPGLAVVLVGDDPASHIYVRNKKRACEQSGVRSFAYDLPATTTEAELLMLLDELNQHPEVDGILVQSPLPKHIDPNAVIERIIPTKDVDGFHPYNVGRLATKNPLLRPCTPRGVMTLLERHHIAVKGLHAVVIGASNIVGRPMGLELLLAQATVTITHSATRDLPALVRSADLVVSGVGKPLFVQADWVKEGAVVVDVGINRLPDGKLVGDVDFEALVQKTSWITPVPGGVGPMTIATLLQNTLESCQRLAP